MERENSTQSAWAACHPCRACLKYERSRDQERRYGDSRDGGIIDPRDDPEGVDLAAGTHWERYKEEKNLE